MSNTAIASGETEAVEQTDDQIWDEAVAAMGAQSAEPEVVAAKEPDPAPEPDPEPETPAPEPVVADIWASATPEQKAAYTAAMERERRYRGAISAKQKAMNALQDKLKPITADDPELKKLAEDYPDVTGPILKRQAELQDQVSTMVEITKLQRQSAQEIESHTSSEQAALVEAQHPKWGQTIQTNQAAFFAWVDDQPKRIRDAVAANMDAVTDANSLAEVLTGFKAFIAHPPQATPPEKATDLSAKRQLQLHGAREINPRGKAASTSDPMAGMDDDDAIWAGIVRERSNRL